jgi:hypothetical protein
VLIGLCLVAFVAILVVTIVGFGAIKEQYDITNELMEQVGKGLIVVGQHLDTTAQNLSCIIRLLEDDTAGPRIPEDLVQEPLCPGCFAPQGERHATGCDRRRM